MLITICHRIELGPTTLAALGEVVAAVKALTRQEKIMSKAEDDLVAQVAANTSAEASATQALTAFAQQVAALTAGGGDSVPAADVEALVAKLQASVAPLAAAIPANTPAAGS